MTTIATAEVEGGLATSRVVLPSGQAVTFDAADADLVGQYLWFTDQGRYVRGYLKGDRLGERVMLHRLLLRPPIGLDVDHINGDGFDNRRANLRVCTHRENAGNMRRSRRNTSGYKGVNWDAGRGKWLARITVDGRARNLGRFDDLWDAAQAYNLAACEAWGEYARLNVRLPA